MDALVSAALGACWGGKDVVTGAHGKPSRWRSLATHVSVLALVALLYVTRSVDEDPAGTVAFDPSSSSPSSSPGAVRTTPVDVEADVDGCPDGSRRFEWDEHCTGQADGVPRARGNDGSGPSVAMLGAPGRDSPGAGATDPPGSLPVRSPAHACNLLMLGDGGMLMVWFSGVEGLAGVVIVASRYDPSAGKWSEPREVSAAKGRSNQNPVLFRPDPAKAPAWVRLYHTSQGGGKGQGSSDVRQVESRDGGKTWGKPKVVFKSPPSGPFVRNQMLFERPPDAPGGAGSGAWLMPFYYTPDGYKKFVEHFAVMKISNNKGRTWRDHAMTKRGQMLAQPSVVHRPAMHGGGLLAFYRDREAKNVFTAESTDGGKTWTAPSRSKLPNNNSGLQACALLSGAIALVFNNRDGLLRRPLSIALSLDGGATWPHVRDLEPNQEDDAVPIGETGEKWRRYSYPSIVQDPVSGYIHVAYTWRRRTIKHVGWLTEDWIKRGGTTGMFKGEGSGSEEGAAAEDAEDTTVTETE